MDERDSQSHNLDLNNLNATIRVFKGNSSPLIPAACPVASKLGIPTLHRAQAVRNFVRS